MASASNTGIAPETAGCDESRLRQLFTGIVLKTFMLVVFLLAFGFVFDYFTANSPITGVFVGISDSLAGVIILAGVIGSVVWAIKSGI